LKIRILILIILIFLISENILSAIENSFPLKLDLVETLSGGRLITDTTNGIVKTYFFKSDISVNGEQIYYWDGIVRKNAKGINLSNIKITDVKLINSSIIILWYDTHKYYISSYDRSLNNKFIFSFIKNSQFSDDKNFVISGILNSELIIKLNNKVYKFDIAKAILLDSMQINLSSTMIVCKDNSRKRFIDGIVKLNISNINGEISFYNNYFKSQWQSNITIYDNYTFKIINKYLVIITSTEGSTQSLCQFIDLTDGTIDYHYWVNSRFNLMSFESYNKINYFARLESNNKNYVLKISNNIFNSKYNSLTDISLPPDFVQPISLNFQKDRIIIIFKNGLCITSINGKILGIEFYPLGEYFNEIPDFNIIKDFYVIKDNFGSLIFKLSDNKFWIFYKALNYFSKYAIPLITIFISIFFIQLYRHEKRLLKEIFELSSLGKVFVLDNSGRLIRSNIAGKLFLNINESIPKHKLFRYYCNDEYSQQIADIIDKSVLTKENSKQRINILENSVMKEWLCSTIVVRSITGQFRGVVFTGIDITEQLERQRLSNLAQLAHDMQTNLSTIKLNAEQFDFELDSINKSRQKKILHQVNLLIQRVRDIVTVGRNDRLDLAGYEISHLLNEVRLEFDETMFPNISFEINCNEFELQCDKPKLLRALRNAVENGIKSFLGMEGKITISAIQYPSNVIIIIEDNGPGMDDKTKNKMMTPYFTTAKKTGGSGIGTMIMQHVIEMHGGKIEIISEKGKGTQIVFNIPNVIYYKKSKLNKKKLFENV
jgi:signal transduction histidine kinase